MLGEYTESSSEENEGDKMGEGNCVVVVVLGTNKSLLCFKLSFCLTTSAAGKKKILKLS